MKGGLEMLRITHFLLLIIFFSVLLLGCQSIHHRQLSAAPDRAVVHVVTEATGELDYWSGEDASYN